MEGGDLEEQSPSVRGGHRKNQRFEVSNSININHTALIRAVLAVYAAKENSETLWMGPGLCFLLENIYRLMEISG